MLISQDYGLLSMNIKQFMQLNALLFNIFVYCYEQTSSQYIIYYEVNGFDENSVFQAV